MGLAWHKLSVAVCVLLLGGGLKWKELNLGGGGCYRTTPCSSYTLSGQPVILGYPGDYA